MMFGCSVLRAVAIALVASVSPPVVTHVSYWCGQKNRQTGNRHFLNWAFILPVVKREMRFSSLAPVCSVAKCYVNREIRLRWLHALLDYVALLQAYLVCSSLTRFLLAS